MKEMEPQLTTPARTCEAVAPVTPGRGPSGSRDEDICEIDEMLLAGFTRLSPRKGERRTMAALEGDSEAAWVQELERVCGELAQSVVQACNPASTVDVGRKNIMQESSSVGCAPANHNAACAVTQPSYSSSSSEDGHIEGCGQMVQQAPEQVH